MPTQTDIVSLYKQEPIRFLTDVLDVKHEHVWSKMTDIAEAIRDNQRVAVKAGNSVSKALDIETTIPTPNGYKKIKDIHIGDYVYDAFSNPTKVIDETDVFEDDCYKVVFEGGAEVLCHKGHLWSVFDFKTRKAIRRRKTIINDFHKNFSMLQTLSTEELSKKIKFKTQYNNYSVPISMSINGTYEVEAPYTIGFWLGDGTTHWGTITVCKTDANEIINKIESEGFITKKHTSNEFGYQVSKGGLGIALRTYLRKIGILDKKHFPEWFSLLTLENKLEILRGYLDADGWIMPNHNSAFVGTTDKLMHDTFVRFLSSIGIKIFTSIESIVYNEQPKKVYKVNFSPDFQPFCLLRKQIPLDRKTSFRNKHIMITDIVPVGIRKVKCISVDNHFGLFQCSERHIVTHNSFTVARLALWFLYTHYPATVVTTAPSTLQVEEILWREIATAHANAKVPLGGEVLRASLDLQKVFKGEKWFAVGFATKRDTASEQVTRFQGFHNENVLIIFDEAAGIVKEIWEAKDKLLTNKKHKFLAIGNPTMARGEFADCFRDSAYKHITVSVKDTPNYIYDDDIIPGLSGRDFEKYVIKKYGEKSNQYKAMITGDIPDEDIDSLIPISWIEHAEERKVHNHWGFVKKFVTWDVADGGDDLHVIKAWENTTEIDSIELRDKKVEEAEPYVWRLLKKIGGNAIIVDCDGIGRVAYSLLQQSVQSNIKVIPFEGSSREVRDPEMFFNKRHEAHWAMRNLFYEGKISIAKIPEQREELAAIKIVNHNKGYIYIEPKKDLKERIGRSPDRADNIMMMAGCFDDVPIWKRLDVRYKNIVTYKEDYPFTPETV